MLFAARLAAAPPPPDQWLQGLANDDYRVRQQTTQRMLADDQLQAEDLARLYARAKLPEQKHRLLDVARHHTIRRMIGAKFGNEGQGAIGITHDAFNAEQSPVRNQPGVLVIETFPGFPGHAYLQRGDLILSINDAPFPPGRSVTEIAAHFMASVKSHPAGTTVRFSVYRDGHTLPLRFALANLNALKSVYNSPENLQQPFLNAWLATRRRLLNAHRQKQPPQTPSPANTDANANDVDPSSKEHPDDR